MKKWKCTVCGYIYDEAQEDMPFASLPEDWGIRACLQRRCVEFDLK